MFKLILGVTVYTPTYILNQSEVIIMFQSGAGVEVVENQGFMTTRAYLPWSFVVRTCKIMHLEFFNVEFDLESNARSFWKLEF